MLTVHRKPESTTQVNYTGVPSPMSSYIQAKYSELKGLLDVPASVFSDSSFAVSAGALNLQDRKMTDKEISGGGNCRTGK